MFPFVPVHAAGDYDRQQKVSRRKVIVYNHITSSSVELVVTRLLNVHPKREATSKRVLHHTRMFHL